MSTCPGTCCERIVLNVSVEEALEGATALVGYRSVNTVRIVDDEIVIDFFAINRDQPGEYICTKFDAARGVCTAYEQRPDLCRRYPYGRPCEHCTFDDRQTDISGVPYRPVAETGFFTPFEEMHL